MLSLLDACRGALRADVFTSETWVRTLSKERAFAHGESAVFGWIPADKLPALYEMHDCLLSIGELPGKQLSSKIFGYMATGKAVVHIYHSDHDANLPYLRAYPLSLCLKDDDALLSDNARRLCLFLLWSRGRRLSFGEVQGLMPKCTPEHVAGLLLENTRDDSSKE